MKLKEKHKFGTVPNSNKLFGELTDKELKEFYNNKGFAHFFEEKKIGRPSKEDK